jgi:hypothetical protein
MARGVCNVRCPATNGQGELGDGSIVVADSTLSQLLSTDQPAYLPALAIAETGLSCRWQAAYNATDPLQY